MGGRCGSNQPPLASPPTSSWPKRNRSSAERKQLAAALAAAEQRHRRVSEQTRPDRDALAAATARFDQARWRHGAAERRLEHARRLDRRQARGDLGIAACQLDRATELLEHARERCAPAVAAYQAARGDFDEASDAVRDGDLIRQLQDPSDQLPALRSRVAALDTWQHWANGNTVNADQLAAAVHTLTHPDSIERSHHWRVLGQAMQTWADDTGLDLHIAPPRQPTPQPAGLELGL